LIVVDPKDPFKGMYNEERVILFSDQEYIPAEETLKELQTVSSTMIACMLLRGPQSFRMQ
jgi:hypothetical protein